MIVDGPLDNTEEAYEDSETRWFADLSTAPSMSLHVGSEGMMPVGRISSIPSERGSIRSVMSSGRGFDELAKEADGDPVSTEESSVATPRVPANGSPRVPANGSPRVPGNGSPRHSIRSSPRHSLRSSSAGHLPPLSSTASSRASTVSELNELAAVSAMARRELKAMETTISRYDNAPPAP